MLPPASRPRNPISQKLEEIRKAQALTPKKKAPAAPHENSRKRVEEDAPKPLLTSRISNYTPKKQRQPDAFSDLEVSPLSIASQTTQFSTTNDSANRPEAEVETIEDIGERFIDTLRKYVSALDHEGPSWAQIRELAQIIVNYQQPAGEYYTDLKGHKHP